MRCANSLSWWVRFFSLPLHRISKSLMQKQPENIAQLIIAALVVLGGMVLLYIGVSIDPKGEIHETVLVAFGEAATFAGSIMGIDYHYKNRFNNNGTKTD